VGGEGRKATPNAERLEPGAFTRVSGKDRRKAVFVYPLLLWREGGSNFKKRKKTASHLDVRVRKRDLRVRKK